MSDGEERTGRPRILCLALGVELGLVAVAVAVHWPLGIDLGLDRLARPEARDVLLGLAASVPMLGLFSILMTMPFDSLKRLRRDVHVMVNDRLGPCRSIDLALIAVAAGVGEEVLFRGLIQGGLAIRFGPLVSLLIASLIFGLAHAVSLTYLIFAALLGLYLGWVFQATGNLVAPIVAHATYDLVALLVVRGERAPHADSGPEDGRAPPIG
jgi:membrane protease YdiL (CAAX protease family)